MRCKFSGGSLDGAERDDVLGRRYIVPVRDRRTGKVFRETYERSGASSPEGTEPVYSYRLKEIEDITKEWNQAAADVRRTTMDHVFRDTEAE